MPFQTQSPSWEDSCMVLDSLIGHLHYGGKGGDMSGAGNMQPCR